MQVPRLELVQVLAPALAAHLHCACTALARTCPCSCPHLHLHVHSMSIWTEFPILPQFADFRCPPSTSDF